MPMISIIIPVYNGAAYLPRALDALRIQTFSDYEIIVVNDGSTDNTAHVLADYVARDSRIVVINKKNGGASDARNVGMQYAHGEFIMFHDADDMIHPQLLEITHCLALRENADMVSYRWTDKPRNTSYDVRRVCYKKTENVLANATEKNYSFGFYRIRHCYPTMALYRADLIRDIKFPTNIKISEDMPWFLRVMLRRPVGVITRLPLYYYIQNVAGALNSASRQKVVDGQTTAIMDIFPFYKRYATRAQFRTFGREFLWPFIISAFRNIDDENIEFARAQFRKLSRTGALDNPRGLRAWKYKRRILKLINE